MFSVFSRILNQIIKRVDDFSRKQLSRLMRARDVFVAMKNPSAEIKSPYLAGFLKLLYTEKLIGDK